MEPTKQAVSSLLCRCQDWFSWCTREDALANSERGSLSVQASEPGGVAMWNKFSSNIVC